MAGTYIEGASKVLSGVYTLIKAAVTRITKGTRGVVAYCFTSDWGPVNQLVDCDLPNAFKTLYNAENTTLTASKVYTHAYKGQPSRVQAYRMATSAAAKGEATLPAASGAALVLETLYPSDRTFVVIVADGTSGKILKIVEDGITRFETEADTLATLEASINNSDYVRVKSKGTALPSNTAGVAFTGGNNGSVSTAAEYIAFLDTLEADGNANAFSLDAVTDDSILTTAETWVQRVRNEGFYITFVCGGPSTWDQAGGISSANAKSKVYNYRGIINVGNGCDGFTAAEMAIFIAARVASVALNKTLTDEPVPYTAVNRKLKPSERAICKQAGTLIFVQIGDSVLIDEAVNTLTTPINGETIEFGKIRVSNTLDYIAKDLEIFGDAYKRDKSNTPEARELYAATVSQEYLAPLAAAEVIRAGYFYKPDPDYHGRNPIYTPKIDEAYFYADITPVDSMERIYQKIGVNF